MRGLTVRPVNLSLLPVCLQSLSVSSREDHSVPSTSHAEAMEPVWGIPSDGQGPVVVHPDGASTQALLVGVGSECKVGRVACFLKHEVIVEVLTMQLLISFFEK